MVVDVIELTRAAVPVRTVPRSVPRSPRGYVLGVSIVVAIIGTPTPYAAVHRAFVTCWWVMAVIVLAAAVACLGLFTRRTHATSPSR